MLFPYTTLFRSGTYEKSVAGGCAGLILRSACACADRCADRDRQGADRRIFYKIPCVPASDPGQAGQTRSEEHTSELQSLRHLVCRLLLEKKKRGPLRLCRRAAELTPGAPCRSRNHRLRDAAHAPLTVAISLSASPRSVTGRHARRRHVS